MYDKAATIKRGFYAPATGIVQMALGTVTVSAEFLSTDRDPEEGDTPVRLVTCSDPEEAVMLAIKYSGVPVRMSFGTFRIIKSAR